MSVHHPEGWQWFDLPSYFGIERVTDVWQVDGGTPGTGSSGRR
jgi:hypothetical protein